MIVAVIPAYNEEKTIADVVKKTKRYVDKVIVINDGSDDKTLELARNSGAYVINHKKNLGLGKSLRDGFKQSIKMNADIIITLDSDGQHDPNDIPKFIKAIRNGYDFVLGKRNLSSYPLIKKIGNLFLNFMTNLISGTTISDTESGFRAYTNRALKKVYPYLKADGYEIASEIIFAAGYYNLKYTNVDISSYKYVKGVTIKDGIRNFAYMLRRRKRNLIDYIKDFKYVVRKWLCRY
ncbi:MAG: glycosyltransferase family 2 protein [Candidatus Aenigmatarchaeota archaeon]